MNSIVRSTVVALSLSVGAWATSVNTVNGIYVFGLGVVLLGLLNGKVNYRNKNWIGVFFNTSNEAFYQLTSIEKTLAIGALALMASPFVYMLFMALFM